MSKITNFDAQLITARDRILRISPWLWGLRACVVQKAKPDGVLVISVQVEAVKSLLERVFILMRVLSVVCLLWWYKLLRNGLYFNFLDGVKRIHVLLASYLSEDWPNHHSVSMMDELLIFQRLICIFCCAYSIWSLNSTLLLWVQGPKDSQTGRTGVVVKKKKKPILSSWKRLSAHFRSLLFNFGDLQAQRVRSSVISFRSFCLHVCLLLNTLLFLDFHSSRIHAAAQISQVVDGVALAANAQTDLKCAWFLVHHIIFCI
jgi:hypothetical protein